MRTRGAYLRSYWIGMLHSHSGGTLGLYGALIIDPANPADEVPATKEYVVQLQEWLMREGLTYPAMPTARPILRPTQFT